MGAARKDFVVVALGDRDAGGYDERTLPLLVALADSTAPDARVFTTLGVVAFYLSSERGVAAARDLVSQAEVLRDRDPQFSSLGIGAAHGPLFADFDWRGRVKAAFIPVGETANRASAGVAREQNYREILDHLGEHQTV
jgi:hypothetical protein